MDNQVSQRIQVLEAKVEALTYIVGMLNGAAAVPPWVAASVAGALLILIRGSDKEILTMRDQMKGGMEDQMRRLEELLGGSDF
jgi:hypothetical protein